MWHLVQDVERHLQVNGPWAYTLSDLYYTPEMTAAVEAHRAADNAQEELSQLAAGVYECHVVRFRRAGQTGGRSTGRWLWRPGSLWQSQDKRR
jgi:hypothetical protein